MIPKKLSHPKRKPDLVLHNYLHLRDNKDEYVRSDCSYRGSLVLLDSIENTQKNRSDRFFMVT